MPRFFNRARNSQYGVTVTFSIRSIAPLPQVVQVQPADGSTGVATNYHPVVRFAEPVQSASIVAGTLRVLQGGVAIDGTVILSSDSLSLSFIPKVSLTGYTAYSVVVQDVAGNQILPLFQSSFTTGEYKDTTAPVVLKTSPDSNATGIPVNAPITVLFSKQMDPAVLTPANFNVQDTTT